jgi:hypothetical protein
MARPYLGGTNAGVMTVTAATTLTEADSGKTMFIDQDAAYTITLPSTQLGLEYTFILTDAGSEDVKIDGGASNKIVGFSMDPTTGINAIDNNMVKFVDDVAVVGDYVRLISDGSVWWCTSFGSASNGILGANS